VCVDVEEVEEAVLWSVHHQIALARKDHSEHRCVRGVPEALCHGGSGESEDAAGAVAAGADAGI